MKAPEIFILERNDGSIRLYAESVDGHPFGKTIQDPSNQYQWKNAIAELFKEVFEYYNKEFWDDNFKGA